MWSAIKWSDKKLAGDFSLTGFKVLSSLDVSRNSLSSIDTKGNSNLTEFLELFKLVLVKILGESRDASEHYGNH